MKLPGFLVLMALLSSPATAAEFKLLTDDGQTPVTHDLEEENGSYEYYTAIGETAETLMLDAATAADVMKIEYSATTSWAVGEDGPWWPIPDSSTAPVWQNIPLITTTAEKISVPQDDTDAEAILTPATIKAAQAAMKADKDMLEPERWITQLNKCDGSKTSPCYSYVSERTFRYTLKSGAVIPVTIHYPGGC